MKTSAGFGKLTAIVAIGAFLASSTAMAQPGQGQPVCRGGILTDAASGQPLLDPSRHTIPCQADDGALGGYVIGGLVLASLIGVGTCAAISGCFYSKNNGFFWVPTGGNNRSSATTF